MGLYRLGLDGIVKITTSGRLVRALGSTVGYDPDATVGAVPVAPDYADDAEGGAWEVPANGAGSVVIVDSYSTSNVTNTFSWDFTPAAGNLIVIAVAIRNGGSSTAPTGWTRLRDNPAGGAFTDGIALYGKVSAGTETSAVFAYAGNTRRQFMIVEASGMTLTGYLSAQANGTGTAITTGSVTPTAGDQALIIGAVAANADSVTTFSPGGGWTELFDLYTAEHPSASLVYQIVASASGSYNPATTASASRDWWGVTAGFDEPAETVWLPAFAVNDGSDTTFDYADSGDVTTASLVFLRGTLAVDVVLASLVIRVGMQNAGSATITVKGSTSSAFTGAVTLGSTTFTGTGSYTAQDVAITLTGTTGYTYVRFLIGSAQGIRVYEVTLAGLAASVAHLVDTIDAHDASAVSFTPTGSIASTDVQAAIAEVAAEAGSGVLNKYNATVAPAVTDDTGDGYAVGSVWVNVTADTVYMCVDATTGAAVWNGPFEPAGGCGPATISGGTKTTSGGYDYHAFTTSGTLTVSAEGVVEVIVVGAGGGGGGYFSGGGGGGGQVISIAKYFVDVGQTVTIGTGGAAGNGGVGTTSSGARGGASKFGAVVASGGGGGRGISSNSGPAGVQVEASDGAQGGGGGGRQSLAGGATTVLGFAGGAAVSGATGGGGGGGGGGSAAGANGDAAGDGGNGGAGTTVAAFAGFGASGVYAGGGGGGASADSPATGGSGGTGGGGAGGATSASTGRTAGTANTGGGGGGGGNTSTTGSAGAAGGSGVVVVRVLTP